MLTLEIHGKLYKARQVCMLPEREEGKGVRGGGEASVLALSRSASDEGQAERAVWGGRERELLRRTAQK